MDNVGIELVALALGVVIASLLHAFFLRMLAPRVAKEKLTFGNAYLAMLIGGLATISFCLGFGVLAASLGWNKTESGNAAITLVGLVAGPVIHSASICWRSKISFGNSLWILILIAVIEILLLGVVVLVFIATKPLWH